MRQVIVQGHGFHQIEDMTLKWIFQLAERISAPPKVMICLPVHRVEGLEKVFLGLKPYIFNFCLFRLGDSSREERGKYI